MPKTKKVRSVKSVIKEETPQHIGMACGCCHHTSIGQCWICWLFKSLIFLFCSFLLIWVGFCLGTLHYNSSYYSHDEKMVKMGGFCSKDSMSQSMSTKSLGLMDSGSFEMLQSLSGADFDKEFLIQMMLHHEDSLEVAKLALEKSKDPEILELAQTIIDEQTKQLEQMKEEGSN